MNKPVRSIKAMTEAQPRAGREVRKRSRRRPRKTLDLPSFETLDHVARALMARVTQGVSPHAQAAAWFDWLSHLSRAPGRQLELALQAFIFAGRLFGWASGRDGVNAGLPFPPDADDRRFADPAWQKMPYLFWRAGVSSRRKNGGATRRAQCAGRRPRTPRASPSWRANCSMSCRRRMFPGSTR